MEDYPFLQWLLKFITSIETLIAVTLGAVIGLAGNIIVQREERKQKEKDRKKEKLAELHKQLSEAVGEEVKLYDYLRFKIIEGNIEYEDMKSPNFTSYRQIKLLIDLDFQGYEQQYEGIEAKSEEITKVRKDFLITMVAIQNDGLTKDNKKRKNTLAKEYYNKLNELEELVYKFQYRLSKRAKKL